MRNRRRAPELDHPGGCAKHHMEAATAVCSSCDRGCCDRCALTVRRQVLCIDCGLVLGGVTTRRRRTELTPHW